MFLQRVMNKLWYIHTMEYEQKGERINKELNLSIRRTSQIYWRVGKASRRRTCRVQCYLFKVWIIQNSSTCFKCMHMWWNISIKAYRKLGDTKFRMMVTWGQVGGGGMERGIPGASTAFIVSLKKLLSSHGKSMIWQNHEIGA